MCRSKYYTLNRLFKCLEYVYNRNLVQIECQDRFYDHLFFTQPSQRGNDGLLEGIVAPPTADGGTTDLPHPVRTFGVGA